MDVDDPLEKLTQEEKRAVAELARAQVRDEVARRDLLKALGLAGGGALLGGGASAAALEATGQAQGGTSESGSVGTSSNPVDLFADDADFGDYSVDAVGGGDLIVTHDPSGTKWRYKSDGTLDTTALTTENVQHTGNVLHTITIRSDGSGDATSLSEAIDLIPAIGIENGKTVSVRFDLESGHTYNVGNPQFGVPWCGGIQLLGDGSNPPIIAIADGGVGVQAVRSNLRFDDVNFATQSGQANHYVFAQYGSRVDLNNVQANGDVDKAVEALYASTVLIDSASTISGENTANSQGANIHSSSHLRLDGQIDNFDVGAHLDRNGTADIIGATVDSCTTGVRAEDGANGKVGDSSAITNHSTGFVVRADGTIKLDGTADLTGNTSNYSVNDVSKLKDNSGTWQTGGAT